MFFDKRELRIKLAKTETNDEAPVSETSELVTQHTANIIDGLVFDITKYVVIGALAFAVTVKVVDVLCTIAEKKATDA